MEIYSEEEARERLIAELPSWQLRDGRLQRVYRTSGWKASLMVVNTIGHLAEAAWHRPDICVSYHAVTVMLYTHKVGGLTDRDLALAKKVEEVVAWQPAKEGSPLRGTPNHEPGFSNTTTRPRGSRLAWTVAWVRGTAYRAWDLAIRAAPA